MRDGTEPQLDVTGLSGAGSCRQRAQPRAVAERQPTEVDDHDTVLADGPLECFAHLGGGHKVKLPRHRDLAVVGSGGLPVHSDRLLHP